MGTAKWWAEGSGFTTYRTPNSPGFDYIANGGGVSGCVPTSANILNSDCQSLKTNNSGWTANFNAFTARSRHPGGVNVVLCDGSTRFVSDGVAWAVWQALGTSRGGEVVGDY